MLINGPYKGLFFSLNTFFTMDGLKSVLKKDAVHVTRHQEAVDQCFAFEIKTAVSTTPSN